MKVKELIDRLSKEDPEADVYQEGGFFIAGVWGEEGVVVIE